MQSKIKKSILVIIASLLALCIVQGGAADIGRDSDGSIKTDENDGANYGNAASINGAVISLYQFENALSYQLDMAAIRGLTITDETLVQIKYEVLANLINQELLYQDSQKFGVTIGADEIDATYETRKQKGNFASDEEFEAALKQTNKTVESYRDEIKQGLAIDRLVIKKFTDNTVVTESEARQYYDANPAYFQEAEKVRASHIMIRFDENADASEKEAAREKIDAIKKRLKAGEEFASVAREVSEDENSRENGGDLGYLSRGQTPQSFETVAFSLGIDEISDVVETTSGYHILKLADKKAARTIGFEEVENDITGSLKSSKVNSQVENYLKALKIKSTIVTYPLDL